MSSPSAQRTTRARLKPHICVVMLLSGTSMCLMPLQVTSAAKVSESSATAAQGSIAWLALWGLLEALDEILNEPTALLAMDTDTEAANLTLAGEQTSRFNLSGLRANLSATERSQGVADCESIKSEILAYPVRYDDPQWDIYLNTLDLIVADLEAGA